MEKKEAMKILKDFYDKSALFSIRTALDTVIPELKESEDELTWLTKYIEEEAYSLSMDIRDNEDRIKLENLKKSLAWLQKQGQTFTKKDVDDAYLKGVCDTKREYTKQDERKPADKVEPKFKVGDWVVTSYGMVNQVIAVDEDGDGFTLDDDTYLSGSWKDNFHLWTIQDAKDGDVLVASDGSIFLFKGTNDCACKHYVALATDGAVKFNEGLEHYWETSTAVHPATKEQRELLFQKMHETGYEWDAEKKELRKMSQRIISAEAKEALWSDKYKGLTYFERTLADICIGWIGEELGWKQYIKDNADILLKIAIKRFNSVQDAPFEQKPAWSEEDEKMCLDLIQYFADGYGLNHNLEYTVDWLKSLKDRVGCEVNCTTTKDWSEEDEAHFDSIIKRLEGMCKPWATYTATRCSISEDKDWLKSLKDRYTWKPSDEQLDTLKEATNIAGGKYKSCLNSLHQDLMKLKG